MDHLSHAMHAASADPPPSSIDLDQIIAGQRRRVHLQSRVGAIAAVAVLGAVVMTVPSLVAAHQGGRANVAGGPADGCVLDVPRTSRPAPSQRSVSASASNPSSLPSTPGVPETENPSPGIGRAWASVMPPDTGNASGGPSSPIVDPSSTNVPQPTEDCAAAEKRLAADMTRMLHRDLPAARITPADGRSSMFARFSGRTGYVGYAGYVTIGIGPATFGLTVTLDQAPCVDQMFAVSPQMRAAQCTTHEAGGTFIKTEGPAVRSSCRSSLLEMATPGPPPAPR